MSTLDRILRGRFKIPAYTKTGAVALNPITVLILSYHFYPSNEIGARRATALARHLAAKGIRVIAVSAFGDHPTATGQEVIPGVFAIPVRRPKRRFVDLAVRLKRRAPSERGPGNSAARADVIGDLASRGALAKSEGLFSRWRDLFFRVAYAVDEYNVWSWAASKSCVRWGRHYGVKLILVSSPPHSAQLAGALAARRLRIPYVADFRDPWSDSVGRTFPTRRIEQSMARALERWVVTQAAAVTSTGGAVADLLVLRSPQIAARTHVIRNGYDGEVQPRKTGTGGRLAILFAGELYLGRDPFPFLRGLEWLVSRVDVDSSRIQVTFMGKVQSYDGVSLDSWLQDKRCLSNVRIVSPQPPQAVAAAVLESTVLLNLAQQQGLSVPAKTFEQLACGREILLICDSTDETARLVAGIAGVHQVDHLDTAALHAVLLDLYRRHVVEQRVDAPIEDQVRKYSRDSANREFDRVLSLILPPD